MEILNSGSFVPLENREKIEQLKFTAKELASEAAKTDGFQNSGPTNQQLALEMWKGAEYMCRAHEETTVRNIFLSSFLEKLRDLARVADVRPPSQLVQKPQPTVPQTPPAVAAAPSVPIAIDRAAPSTATDEYLGIVPAMGDSNQELRSSYADECVPEYDANLEAIVDRLDSESSNLDVCGSTQLIRAGSEESAISADINVASKKSEPDIPLPTDHTAVDELMGERVEAEDTVPPASPESASVASIVIADKEPYNFDSCTVTSVIQLLPENNGIRKCVVSVRSHDFVPHITISEVANGSIFDDIKRGIETAFEQYRTSLPALAAEKIKKEKPATKKRSAKPAEKGKVATATAESQNSVAVQAAQNSEVPQGQNTLFAS